MNDNKHRVLARKLRSKNSQKISDELLTGVYVLLGKGWSQSDVAKLKGLKKQNIHYYVKKWKGKFLEPEFENSLIFRFTDLGKKILAESQPLYRTEGVSLGYPIIKDAELPFLKNETKLKNWTLRYGEYGTVNIRKTTQHLIISLGHRYGINPFFECMKGAVLIDRVVRDIQNRFNIQLGFPEPARRLEIASIEDNPVIEEVSKILNLIMPDWKVDRSYGKGELEYFENLDDA